MPYKKILILHENIGFGHTKIAEVIRDGLKEKYPKIKIKYTEIAGKDYPLIKYFVTETYLWIIGNIPFLWEFLHQSKVSYSGNKFFINIGIGLIKHSFRKILDEFKPDIVVSTYAFSAGVVSRLKEEGYNVKLISVATDFYLHDYWIYKNIDKYCVPFNESAVALSKKWINKKKIIVTGIPVSNKFLKKIPRELAKKKLNFDPNLPLIMVVYGGAGIGKLKYILEYLDSFNENIQIAVITGTNKELYTKLINMTFNHKIKIFRFINNMDEFMSASDFIIGKAGGSLLSESLTKRVPTLIYGKLPAQERLNAEFISSHKLGYIALNDTDFKKIIKKIVSNPKILSKTRSNISKYSMEFALDNVLNLIIRTLNSKNESF